MERNGKEGRTQPTTLCDDIQGIVVTDGSQGGFQLSSEPRIQAFIWGGKVRPSPILPYGRWKGAA